MGCSVVHDRKSPVSYRNPCFRFDPNHHILGMILGASRPNVTRTGLFFINSRSLSASICTIKHRQTPCNDEPIQARLVA